MNPLPQNELSERAPSPRSIASPETIPIEAAIRALLDSDGQGWTELVGSLHPLIMKLCAFRVSKHHPSFDDLCRDVATATLERLRKNSYAALHRYRETSQTYKALRFESWLRVVVSNVHTDVLRALPDNQRLRVDGTRRLVHREVRTLSHDPASSESLLQNVEVRRILSWMDDPKFPHEQRSAIALWLRGYDESDIADTLQLSNRTQATRLLRAARQRLRRHFEAPDDK